jgi:acyl-coenzyme A thioesterase PaaI-like protein
MAADNGLLGYSKVLDGKLINISNSLVVSEGTLRDKDGTLYAHATATCMIFRRKQTTAR